MNADKTTTLDKAYDPKPVEAKWLSLWEAAKSGASTPRGDREKRFVIVIPPPNVTGALHIGHALDNTLQDLLIRWKKLHGYETCWVPGTDHGGIATQNVMEKQLKAENKTRQQLGREAFVERMQQWTRDTKKTILGQLRKLGCNLDWDREAFTMDEQRAKSVYAAFKGLWDKGLIYRGERMVNWCVRCGTALSDIEVEREERKGALYHIHYPLENGAEGIVVATTRPITMFGDTAVAVNPKDKRWTHLVGKKVRIPLIDRAIPVIEDPYVEFEFGTGGLKVTPAHDANDWEIGQRHKLPIVKAIGPDGKLTEAAGPYAGLSREKAQDQVLADLEAKGFLRKKEDHKSAVQTCYRCASVIEPLASWQWFVRMKDLAAPALEAYRDGRFTLVPEVPFGAQYSRWLEEIRDWCVSRQIWWGHRIPVWYCVPCNRITPQTNFGLLADARVVVSQDKPAQCLECGGAEFVQDPDVLDTWFSSGLWPMSVFGWPDKTADFDFYYPTQVLVTGYEILYLWVARMQMMGLHFTGRAPFSHGMIHGIVRDKSGKKMSKSLGNVIDPLVMMDKFGTDALRFSLVIQAHPGKDIPFAEDSITGSRNFVNKLWNSTRFVLMNLPQSVDKPYSLDRLSHCCLELADAWILAEYQKTIAKVGQAMDSYDVAAAGDALYAFLWDSFCDWYVELAKIRLQGIDGEDKENARAILVQVLSGTLKLLHPFMPFVTEELFAALKPYTGETADLVLRAGAPRLDFDWSNAEAQGAMGRLMQAVTALRSLRSQLNVNPGLKLRVVASSLEGFSDKQREYLKTLARVDRLETGARPDKSATAVAAGASFFVPLEGVIDFAQERARLQKEQAKSEAELAKISQKADNPNFRSRAPKDEVDLALAQKAAAAEKLERLKETLALLS
jgi:valyl-tRNA synthetase